MSLSPVPSSPGSSSGQSEEMIQTGAADDRSALGSPSSQDTQPYSIVDSVTGLRTFPCENCDKQFTDPSNLQRHIRSQHVGARSHACSECGKTFATSSGLKQHQHIHSSVKPFQCEVCLKAYTQFSNLCRHKRMHADCRQQIKCKDCGQAFSTMTSLSKHKRFCEGMLRPNGQQRIAYPGLTSPGADKTATGLGLLNAAAQNPSSALASAYMSMYPQPHRPPFPFYPPAFGGAGFPLFPGGHPMAGGMAPGLDGKLGALGGVSGKAPGSPGAGSLHGQTGELKREKNASEGSEADSSDVSSASDLDTSTGGSDVDSEYHHHHHSHHHHSHRRRVRGARLHGPVPVVNSHTRLAKSPLHAAAPPAAHGREAAPRSPPDVHAPHPEDDDDGPFDLSKSSPPTPVSFASSSSGSSSTSSTCGADQPLDLSVRAKDTASTPKTTPRKTHIFGGSGTPQQQHHHHHHHQRGNGSGSGSSDGKRTPTSRATPTSLAPTHARSSSSPETSPSSPVAPVTSSGPERSTLHYAYPSMASPVVIEPMYRVDKEKPQSYHDVVAQMMAYGPPRLPMHHHQSPLGFGGLQAGMGLLSPARPDAAKLLPPMLGKTPDHFAYHSSNVNKLKERYACKFCGKIFPRSANLTRHLRTHTGEQPYKCKYCERSFSISSNLQRHVRNIHNKEKPFKCPLCDRCFGQQTNLDRHLKKHESDDPSMLDSPLPHEQELEEKDESYFDEIRNFIGKATAEGGEEGGVSGGGAGVVPGGDRVKREPGADGIVDSHFSLTGQVVEKPRTAEKRPAPEDDLDEDEVDDLDDLDEEDAAEAGSGSPSSPKKSRLENNNVSPPTAQPVDLQTTSPSEGNALGNGFHEDEDELEDELEDEEDLDEDERVSLNGLGDTAPQINNVKAPMACTS